MKAKLIKHEVDYYCLLNDKGEVIADVNGGDIYKLSLKNCQAIEREYDLDELAYDYSTMSIFIDSRATEAPTIKEIEDAEYISEIAFKAGFRKALEILGDKKFTKEDLLKTWNKGAFYGSTELGNIHYFNGHLKSLQQNEWDVEIEMEEKYGWDLHSNPPEKEFSHLEPKLDADGFIILKRV